MIRAIRVTGFALIGLGLVVLAAWFIAPLRALWPWYRALPLVIQIGLGVAALGLAVLFASLVVERIQRREHDRSLLDDRF